MAQRGKDLIIKCNTGTQDVPVWTAVGGQRDYSRTRSASTIDAGDKLSSVRKKLAGDREESIRLDALYIDNDDGQILLRQAYYSGSLVQVQTFNFGNPVEEMLCSITNLSEAHPDQGVSTMSIELQLASDPIGL